jgi:hypothetical protein
MIDLSFIPHLIVDTMNALGPALRRHMQQTVPAFVVIVV